MTFRKQCFAAVLMTAFLILPCLASAQDLNDLLANTDLFHSLTPEQLDKVASLCTQHTGAPGDVLIPQDEVLDKMYTLVSGHAVVLVEGVGQVYEFGPGIVVGEASFVTHGPSIASVELDQESEVVVIDAKTLREMMDADTDFGYAVMNNIAYKLTTY
ncbi:MAG: cyclic nucleotide-binding domain-containing protein [Desulfovibrio sp.]|nr:MAG: cyclic nucleotide-binding domain-containing protein [Desulfovibrio sp.]